MFVSLVKIKKYLIYLFLFLFFNCLFTISLKAEPTLVDGTVVDDQGGDANQSISNNSNQEAELMLTYNY